MYDASLPRLGLCCLLVGKEKTKFRTTKRTWAQKHPEGIVQHLHQVWRNNIVETCRVINYCIANNIWCYRLSSDLFALADLEEYWDAWRAFKADDANWMDVRARIKTYLEIGGRVSTHPGQFCVISNEDASITARSILNLEHHADFFDAMCIPQSYFCPINIHLSNGKRESAAAKTIRKNLKLLTPSLRSRLVFETEDKSYWTWQRLQEHFAEVPITLDYHHRLINNLGEPEAEAHAACVASWTQHNIKPLFHYTEGRTKPLDRSHADVVQSLPPYRDADMEIEAKAKNDALEIALRIQGNMIS